MANPINKLPADVRKNPSKKPLQTNVPNSTKTSRQTNNNQQTPNIHDNTINMNQNISLANNQPQESDIGTSELSPTNTNPLGLRGYKNNPTTPNFPTGTTSEEVENSVDDSEEKDSQDNNQENVSRLLIGNDEGLGLGDIEVNYGLGKVLVGRLARKMEELGLAKRGLKNKLVVPRQGLVFFEELKELIVVSGNQSQALETTIAKLEQYVTEQEDQNDQNQEADQFLNDLLNQPTEPPIETRIEPTLPPEPNLAKPTINIAKSISADIDENAYKIGTMIVILDGLRDEVKTLNKKVDYMAENLRTLEDGRLTRLMRKEREYKINIKEISGKRERWKGMFWGMVIGIMVVIGMKMIG